MPNRWPLDIEDAARISMAISRPITGLIIMKFHYSSLLKYISKFSLEYVVRHSMQTLVTYVFLFANQIQKSYGFLLVNTRVSFWYGYNIYYESTTENKKLHESKPKCQIRMKPRNTLLEKTSIKSVELIFQICGNLNHATTTVKSLI